MAKGSRNHIKKSAGAAEKKAAIQSLRASQRSRKGTKAWRKNIDISEVTSGLERLREQKIQGGVVSEKPNDALFKVDVGGDNSVIKRERLGKTLRSDEILALKSAIQPVSGFAHKNSALGSGIVNRKKKGPLPPSELLRLKKIANRAANASNGSNAAASLTKAAPKEYDVWDTPPAASPSNEVTDVWVEPAKSKKPPVTYGHAPEVLTTTGTALPAIEIAEAGQSYNPPITEWNDLIERKAQEQVKLDAAQKIANKKNRAAQAVDERFEIDPAKPQAISDDESDASEAGSISSPIAKQNTARATAKTTTQRNKEARKAQQVALEAAIRARKAERKALSSLGDAIAQIPALSETEKQDLVASVASTSQNVLRRHKFGKHAIPADPLEIQLSDELAGSLRSLKPEGNLFKDRFHSLVKRGIIESRVPQSKKRRYALLHKEKYSHKFEAGRPFMA